MAFDRMGRRVEMRTVTDEEETLQRFVYDNYLCIQQLRGTDNAPFHSYIWDPTKPIATRPLIFLPASGETAYYFHDGNKNVSILVSTLTSVCLEHYEYAPFGEQKNIVTIGNPFLFSSEFYEKNLGLIYYNFRHYSPLVGRWGRRDPIQEHNNQYTFINNNPLKNSDLLGLVIIPWNATTPIGQPVPLNSPKLPVILPSPQPWDITTEDEIACPKKCFNGKMIQLVRIWSCKRPLKSFPMQIGSLYHQYIYCSGNNRNCYGVQAKTLRDGGKRTPTKKGDLILAEEDPSGDCELRCVMPEEKRKACNGRCQMPKDYALCSYNCQDWAESVTTTKAK